MQVLGFIVDYCVGHRQLFAPAAGVLVVRMLHCYKFFCFNCAVGLLKTRGDGNLVARYRHAAVAF